MLAESTEALITRICRSLNRAEGFALFFVQANLPTLREDLSEQVQLCLQRPVVQLTLAENDLADMTLDQWLQEQMAGQAAESVIFIHGLDLILPREEHRLRGFFQQINWRRAALAAIKRPVVFCLPRHALNSFAEHAPDCYDWYSNVYEFTSSEEELIPFQKHFDTEFTTAVHPAFRLSKAGKEQWLHTLSLLLNEHREGNAYRAKLLSEAGMLHYSLGDMDDALALCQQSLAICQEIGHRAGEGTCLNNISQIHKARGDLAQALALQYLEQSLAICQEIGDRKGEGTCLNNICAIHHARGDFEQALHYLEQALAIFQEIGDRAGEAGCLNNISLIYKARGDLAQALQYLEQSLAICQEIGYRAGEGTCLSNISQIHKARGDLAQALQYIEQSLAIRQEIGDAAGLCVSLFNASWMCYENNDMQKAQHYWEQSYQLAKKIGYAEMLQDLEDLAHKLGCKFSLEGLAGDMKG